MPAARARLMSGAMGSITAVGEVMWLRYRTRVLGVTPAHTVSSISLGLLRGIGNFWTTVLAWRWSQTNVHVRSSAPYSWSLIRISSPGASGSERATRLSAAVTLGT